MSELKKTLGTPVTRIDGLLKVTGAAQYAADFAVKNAVYAFLVKSEIAAGKVLSVDKTAAEKSSGVIVVIAHDNALKLKELKSVRGGAMLQTAQINYWGETVAVVVAETFEQARAAARLVKINYQKSPVKVDFDKLKKSAATPKAEDRQDKTRGDVDAAMSNAEFKLEQIYETPIEHHQPLSPHATIAFWEADDKLTVYNESQVVNGVQGALAAAFGLKPENARVITPHIGGGFGSKGGAWGHVIIAAMAAKIVKRPVKLVLTRQMMFNSVGLRQRNEQRIRLAATKDGKLTALAHETTTHCAIDNEFVEPCGDVSAHLYSAENHHIAYRVAAMNVIVPTYTRAPGKSTGSFALESAIDELAYQLKIDPVELRLKNEPDKDPDTDKPWSSRVLVAALREGAAKFGWQNRKFEPRSTRRGEYLIGHGVGCGVYPARQRDSSAFVKLVRNADDVRAFIELAASDLGTGTYTILAQTAADALGLPVNKIAVKIGDSALPPAAGSVGSVGATSFANAVNDACEKITNELRAKSGKQFFKAQTAAELMIAENIVEFETRADAKPLPDADKFAAHSFSANFAEVWVNAATGMTKVRRVVAAIGAGRILNPRTANSQIIGGVIWGIGQALTEESTLDPRYGNFVTRTLADYHVPSNLDVGEIETVFINENDLRANKMGLKGVGEIAIVGVAAAIANAIFNATGKRVRSLPITPDKLL